MSILNLNQKFTRPVALGATGLFFVAFLVFFLALEIPHKVTIPVGILTVASLWLCPWQMTMALLFGALGDYFGSCNNFLAQMGFFAVAGEHARGGKLLFFGLPDRSISDGFGTSTRPLAHISNTPISFVEPKRFFAARRIL